MEAVSCAPYLETLELVDCEEVTDAGMCFIASTPCLINLTIRLCGDVTDVGVAELVQAQKLESLIIEGCPRVSLQAVKGIARSVQYSVKCASSGHLNRKFHKNSSVLDLL
jgi:F-box/leucine-rich repeat protein 2/20